MSGKRSSSRSRSPSGPTGRRPSFGRRAAPALRFLLRAGFFYALVFLCWKPFQETYVKFIAAGAERVFRLIDQPPLITALSAQGNRIAYFSFLTGFDEPMGSLSFAGLHLYFVTALALVLAVPLRDRLQRLRLVLVTLVLFVAVSLAICVVGIKSGADGQAMARYGITLLTDKDKSFLDWANRTMLMVGMLAFPAYLFFVAFFSRWLGPGRQTAAPAAESGWRAWTRGGRLRAVVGLVAVLLVGGIALTLWTRAQSDPLAYLDGWGKIMKLNPSFAPAKVNVALQLQQQGKLDEAIALYREALEIAPEMPGAHYNLGNALRESSQYVEAAKHYERVLELEPDHAAALRNLGHTLDALKRPCEALRNFERSIDLQPAYMKEKRFADSLIRHREICRPR